MLGTLLVALLLSQIPTSEPVTTGKQPAKPAPAKASYPTEPIVFEEHVDKKGGFKISLPPSQGKPWSAVDYTWVRDAQHQYKGRQLHAEAAGGVQIWIEWYDQPDGVKARGVAFRAEESWLKQLGVSREKAGLKGLIRGGYIGGSFKFNVDPRELAKDNPQLLATLANSAPEDLIVTHCGLVISTDDRAYLLRASCPSTHPDCERMLNEFINSFDLLSVAK